MKGKYEVFHAWFPTPETSGFQVYAVCKATLLENHVKMFSEQVSISIFNLTAYCTKYRMGTGCLWWTAEGSFKEVLMLP